MGHTKEPWEATDRVISNITETVYEGRVICRIPDETLAPLGYANWEANARRIVACVNACKDIPSEKLDGLATMARLGIELTDAINDPDGRFNRLEKEHYANEFALDKAGISGEDCGAKVSKGIELLTAQRDELLAALKEVSLISTTNQESYFMYQIAIKAVKKHDHA